jgi:hypothetical protein
MGYQPGVAIGQHREMQTDLSTRLESVLGGDVLTEIALRLAAEGCIVSPQAIHKWKKGGPISEENLQALCRAYDIEPAWLRYGVGPRSRTGDVESPRDAAAELIESLPADAKQETLDFIEWKVQRSPFVDREQFGRYLRMIDRIKQSLPTVNEPKRTS